MTRKPTGMTIRCMQAPLGPAFLPFDREIWTFVQNEGKL